MIPLHDDNPSRRPPIVTILLLLTNVAFFLYELSLPRRSLDTFIHTMGVIPAEFTSDLRLDPHIPLPLTLLTSMFLHGGAVHLAGNMLYLWIFGNNVEDATGHVRFLIFYVACGVGAAATQIGSAPGSTIPMIGASGAIAGVLGAYMLLYPRARVLTLVPILFILRLMYLPAIVVLGLWFVYQILLSGMSDPDRGGVAFFAHIGGFVAGMILIWPLRRRGGRRRPGTNP